MLCPFSIAQDTTFSMPLSTWCTSCISFKGWEGGRGGSNTPIHRMLQKPEIGSSMVLLDLDRVGNVLIVEVQSVKREGLLHTTANNSINT